MSRLTRQEMKRDEVREFLTRAMRLLSENAKAIGIGIVVVALLVVVVSLTRNMIGGRQAVASDALVDAMRILEAPIRADLASEVPATGPVYETGAARDAEARGAFQTVIEDHPRSKAARIARFYTAKIDFESGSTTAARETWEGLVESGGDDAMSAQALINLLSLDRDEGRGAEAEARLMSMVDDPSSLLPQPTVLYQLALTQEMLGKEAESRASYQRLLDEHPTSPHAQVARQRVGGPTSPFQ